jgi:hypothetical protein
MANRNPNTKGLIPWKPGQSGNPSGRPRVQPISDRYAHIAEEKLPENIRKKLKLGPGATYGDAIALRTFQAALEGDIAATREVRDSGVSATLLNAKPIQVERNPNVLSLVCRDRVSRFLT